MLAAKRIDLTVLGPRSIYLDYSLGWLARVIEYGLAAFCRQEFGPQLEMHFGFEAFAPDFKWPGADPDELPGYFQSRCVYTWPGTETKAASRVRMQALPSVSVSSRESSKPVSRISISNVRIGRHTDA